MSTVQGIRDVIAAWARDESGLGTVIISRSSEIPQPRNPYVSVFVSKNETFPFPLQEINKITNVVTTNTRARLDFEINIFDNNALDRCTKLIASLWAQERDIDGFANFGFGGVSEAKDLSFLQQDNFRQQGQFTLFINANLTTTLPGSVLKSSEIVLEAPEQTFSETLNIDSEQPECNL